MSTLDPEVFGGELAKLLDNHSRLAVDAREAAKARDEAHVALSEACADDQRAAVSAKLAGKTVPGRTREEKAEIAVRETEYNATIATQAWKASMDAAVEECRNSTYDETLAERESSITEAALRALGSLEDLLNEIATVRAYRGWLKSPTRADEIVEEIDPEDVWITSVTRPNGESARTSDMLTPVRQALEGTDQPRGDQWNAKRDGLPAGYELTGPWGPVAPTPAHQRRMAENDREAVISGPAARAFEEALQPAEEAPA